MEPKRIDFSPLREGGDTILQAMRKTEQNTDTLVSLLEFLGDRVFHRGEGVPEDSLGVEGDVYLDTLSPSLYVKGAVEWDSGVSLAGPRGDTGASSYEAAVSEGFSGTREEWLSSLIGPKGDTEQRLRSPAFVSKFSPTPQIITSFAEGHGWEKITTSGVVAEDPDHFLSDRSVSLTTAGDGATCEFGNYRLSPIDATSKDVRLWLKVSSFPDISDLRIYLGNENFSDFFTAGVMSGSPDELTRFAKSGEWFSITLSFANMNSQGTTPDRSSIAAIKFRVVDRGGERPVTVKFGGVGLVRRKEGYPKGLVSFSFDDFSPTIYTTSRRIMSQYGWAGTFYAICDDVGKPDRISLSQTKSLQDEYGWEIGGHSFTLANHNTNYPNLSDEEAEEDIRRSKLWLTENNLHGETFSWPNGSFDSRVEEMCYKYYFASRTTASSLETLPPAEPMRLRTRALATTTSLSAAKAEVDKAASEGNWLIFMGHAMVEGVPTGANWAVADFEELCAYVHEKGCEVTPVGEALGTMQGSSEEMGLTGDHAHAKLERIPDSETSQRTVYVSPGGSNSTGDGTAALPWATIQHAIDQAQTIMQRRSSTSAYRILCKTGTYEEAVVISPNLLSGHNAGGQGGIWIESETGNAADVLITNPDGVGQAAAINVLGSCTIKGLTLENDRRGVYLNGGPTVFAHIQDCVMRRRSLENGGEAAIDTLLPTSCVSWNNSSVEGRLFSHGLSMFRLGRVARIQTQPSGSVANTRSGTGGVIA